jgi:hypothetical protein
MYQFAAFILFIALIENEVSGSQSPANTTACSSCSSVCSTVPPSGSTYPLCYQGTPNATRDEYNNDPDNPSDSVPVCSTCSSNGFDYFVANEQLYADVEVWSNENPLCALMAATNIGALVTAGSMQGWSCNGMTATSDYCNGWTGVSCSNVTTYPMSTTVSSLALGGLGITGTLPPQLVGLNYMTSLDLSRNSLNGPLTNLTTQLLNVDLSHNSFSGSIPEFMGYIYSALSMNLASNSFEQQIPSTLGLLQHMNSLNLSSNLNLFGSVPSEICADQLLTFLDVGNNPSLGCYSNCLTTVTVLVVTNAEDNCVNDLIAAEGAALCDLYQATNIPSLAAAGMAEVSGWNCTDAGQPIGDFCAWAGVSCGISVPDDGRVQVDDILEMNTTVVDLSLPFIGLQGTLPSSLGQLSYLNSVNLGGNLLHGGLSPEYNSLSRLVSASFNQSKGYRKLSQLSMWYMLSCSPFLCYVSLSICSSSCRFILWSSTCVHWLGEPAAALSGQQSVHRDNPHFPWQPSGVICDRAGE